MTDAVTDAPARRWPFTVSVVIAALNEAPTIGDVIARTLAHCPGAEVLVIDDYSTDDTAARAEAAGARVIRRPYTLGQGAGVKTGVRSATGEVVVLIDGDGQHDLPRRGGSGTARSIGSAATSWGSRCATSRRGSARFAAT